MLYSHHSEILIVYLYSVITSPLHGPKYSRETTVYSIKHVHNFDVFCFLMALLSLLADSCDLFGHIIQGCFIISW